MNNIYKICIHLAKFIANVFDPFTAFFTAPLLFVARFDRFCSLQPFVEICLLLIINCSNYCSILRLHKLLIRTLIK